MRPEERDEASLWDMRRYALQSNDLVTSVSFEDFLADPVRRLAVERSVEIIGEAAGRVSPDFRAAHPEIAWRQMVGLRNILVHNYSTVDAATLWQVVTEYIPDLLRLLDPLIPEPPADEE